MGVMCAPLMTYLSWEIQHGNINNYMDSYAWVLQLLFTTATVANTFLLTIDRYVAIVHPLIYSRCWLTRHRPLYTAMTTAWLICTLWAVFPTILVSIGIIKDPYLVDCWHSYTILYSFYGLPLALVLLMNIVIVITINKFKPGKTGQVSPSIEQVDLIRLSGKTFY